MVNAFSAWNFKSGSLQVFRISPCLNFVFSKVYVNEVHSSGQLQCERRVLAPPIHRKGSVREKNPCVGKEPATFMRNIIANITNILRYSTWDSAREELAKFPVRWDSYTVNQTLKTHPPLEKAWLFFNWASQFRGFKHDQFTYTTMLDIFGEAGRTSSMKYLYDQMKENDIKIDVVTYTSLMHWLAKDGDFEASIGIWNEMKDKGFQPTLVSYTAFMKVLFDNGKTLEAGKVYKEMIRSGCLPNCHTYTVLIQHLAGAGKFKEALEVMAKMKEAGVQPDKPMCNIFVEKCSEAGETLVMAQILKYMKDNKIVLRYPIYLKALEALKSSGQCEKLLQEVNPHLSSAFDADDLAEVNGTATDVSDRVLILTLFGRRNFVGVDHMLYELTVNINSNLGLEPITIIITNCVNERMSTALLAFQYSVRIGVKLKKATYLILIGHLLRLNLYERAVSIVSEMAKSGIVFGEFFSALLMYKLGCAKLPDLAARIFELLSNAPDVTAFTVLIDASFRVGDIDRGLALYGKMLEKGVLPSSATYAVLICGLKNNGRTHEVEAFRKKQKVSQRRGDHTRNYADATKEHLCHLLFDTNVFSGAESGSQYR